jgi:hypothetical protein
MSLKSSGELWTPEEDALIRDLVKNGIRTIEMPIFLTGRTHSAIENHLHELKLGSGIPARRYTKDEQFWSVPNPINCYYAGWIAADGSLQNAKRQTLSLVCEITDEPQLKAFVAACGWTGNLQYILKKSPKGPNEAIHCIARISACKRWNADLQRVFNLAQNKTYRLAPPYLGSDYLMFCYLIGLLDGDGTVSISKTKSQLHIAYGSASARIVEWVQSFVEEKIPFQIRSKPQRIAHLLNGGYHHYVVRGLRAVKLVELARRMSIPRFARKWDRQDVTDIIAHYRSKWPEWFTPDRELSFDSSGSLVIGQRLAA